MKCSSPNIAIDYFISLKKSKTTLLEKHYFRNCKQRNVFYNTPIKPVLISETELLITHSINLTRINNK